MFQCLGGLADGELKVVQTMLLIQVPFLAEQ